MPEPFPCASCIRDQFICRCQVRSPGDPSALEWINRYTPETAETLPRQDNAHILWAADVWFSIKKHWVIELQRMMRARSAQAARQNHRHAENRGDLCAAQRPPK